MTDISLSALFRAPLAAAHVAATLLILSSAANAAVIESDASMAQFGANCKGQGGKFSTDGNGGGGTCISGNSTVYCTKANPSQGPKDAGIVCSVKTGGGSAAKILRKLVKVPPRTDNRTNNDSGNGGGGGNDGGGAGGSNVGGVAPSGPTKGSGGGCSGGVC